MVKLGRVGIWSRELRGHDAAETSQAVAELESLGFGAIWMPGQRADTFFPLAEAFLAATSRMAVVSGILSVWTNTPEFVAAAHRDLSARFPDRLLTGLGVSHQQRVKQETGQKLEHPLAVMRDYLDRLERTDAPIPHDELVLAALGPKMLRLAGDRSSGAHPYFVPVEHTRLARETLGHAPLLAPEQAAVLETDPDRARRIARRHVERYLEAPNYTNNLRRLGYGDDDVTGSGSDRLVDAIVAWGDPAAIARRVAAHFEAGADHVCIQVIAEDAERLPMDEWRALAPALAAL